MADQSADVVEIERVLAEHVDTATMFCRACPDLRPATREQLEEWDGAGIRRHQAEQIAEALRDERPERLKSPVSHRDEAHQ